MSASGKITSQELANGAVTAQEMASGAAVNNIGYTPVNKTGDHITGALTVDGGVSSNLTGKVNGINFFIGNTAPTTMSAGDQWYDTSVNRQKYYNGTAWVDPMKYV